MAIRFIDYTGYQNLSFKTAVSVLDDSGNPFNLSGYTPSGCVFEQFGSSTPSSRASVSILSAASGKLQFAVDSDDISELFPVQNRYWLTLNSGDGPFVIQEGFFYLKSNPSPKFSTGISSIQTEEQFFTIDITSGAVSQVITFPHAFEQIPSISLTVELPSSGSNTILAWPSDITLENFVASYSAAVPSANYRLNVFAE